jgi:hypothetical protein
MKAVPLLRSSLGGWTNPLHGGSLSGHVLAISNRSEAVSPATKQSFPTDLKNTQVRVMFVQTGAPSDVFLFLSAEFDSRRLWHP